MAARRQNPRHFREGRAPISHVAQAKRDRHDVEARLGKWQLERIGQDRIRQAFSSRDGQHLGRKISRGDLRFRQFSRNR